MEFEGTVIFELPMAEGIGKNSGRPWKKREWVLETGGGMYPRKVKVQAFNDRADALQFEVGKAYAVSIEIESREFNGRWYTDVNAIGARPLDMPMGGMPQQAAYHQQSAAPAAAQPAPSAFTAQSAPAADPFAASDNSTDDLPF